MYGDISCYVSHPKQGLREELNEASLASIEAFNQQDVEKAALFYTEDCSVMAPGFDVAHGREGKRCRVQQSNHWLSILCQYS